MASRKTRLSEKLQGIEPVLSAVRGFVGSIALTTAMAVAITTSSASAAPITFGSAVSVGTGTTSLVQQGTVVQAINFGIAAGSPSLTAGGVTFTAAAAGDIVEAENLFGPDASVYGSNSDANFQTVLRSFGWRVSGAVVGPPAVPANTMTILLTGLTVGQRYSLQLFAVDQRSAASGRTVSFNSFNAATGASTGTAGLITVTNTTADYVIGTFIADATTQSFRATGSTNAYLSALVLRVVPEINVGSSAIPMLCLCLAFGGMLERRRRVASASAL